MCGLIDFPEQNCNSAYGNVTPAFSGISLVSLRQEILLCVAVV